MHHPPRLQAPDAWCSVVVALVSILTYWLTRQDWLYGDGVIFVDRLVSILDGAPMMLHIHALYIPACWFVEAILPGYQPLAALHLVSAGSCAVALPCAFLLARAFGVSRNRALAATALVGVTPAIWFFATTIELHSLHAAGVSVSACVTVFAPWARIRLAVLMSAVMFSLVYVTHRSGVLLGPAWLLLAQLARRRSTGESFGWRGLIFGIGVTHLASLLVAMFIVDQLGGTVAAGGMGFESTLAFVKMHHVGYRTGLVVDGVLFPFAFLIPVVALGLLRQRGVALLFNLAAILPIALFLLFLFGDPTEGGYLLGLTPFLVILAGQGLDRVSGRVWPWILVLLFVCQTSTGIWRVKFSGHEYLGTERQARAQLWRAALADGGTVITLDPTQQTLNGMFEDLREINALRTLQDLREKWTPAQAAAAVVAMVPPLRPMVFDLRYADGVWSLPEIHSYADALVASLESHPATRRITLGSHPVLIISSDR